MVLFEVTIEMIKMVAIVIGLGFMVFCGIHLLYVTTSRTAVTTHLTSKQLLRLSFDVWMLYLCLAD